MAFQYGRQGQWVNSSFPNLELNILTDLLHLIVSWSDSYGLRRARTGFACCVFNNSYDHKDNKTILLPETSPKCHLKSRWLWLGECQTAQGFTITVMTLWKMRSNCISSHCHVMTFSPPFSLFFCSIRLHTVKEHHNKQWCRGTERLQHICNSLSAEWNEG